MVPAGGRVRGRLGGGGFEEADEGGGGGKVGADGDEGGEDACVAVREVLDFEGEVTSLVGARWCGMRREMTFVRWTWVGRVWDGNGDCSGCE